MANRSIIKPIVVGGVIAGTLDITYACVFSYVRSGRTPTAILQSVASGALGRDAYNGGAKIAVLGLFLHFLIALLAATSYVLASRALPFMISHWATSGILFGFCVYAFMNCVVLRLSAIHVTAWPWQYPKSVLIGGLLIHIFGIGLPIAVVTRKFSR